MRTITVSATLQRDTHDTLAFHTNLNATHTTHPPRTDHPPEPHPAIPTTPWQHIRYWVDTTQLPPTSVPPRPRPNPANDVDTAEAMPTDWLYEPDVARPPVADRRRRQSTARGLCSRNRPRRRDRSCPRRPRDGPYSRPLPTTPISRRFSMQCAAPTTCSTRRLRTPASMSPSAYRLFNAAKRLAATLAATASPPRLFIVTRNAQPLSEGDRANPVHAALWGLGRTLALEHPEIWGGIIDLDDAVPAVLAARYVLAEARADDGEDQVVYRAGVRHVPRLERRQPPPIGVDTLECRHQPPRRRRDRKHRSAPDPAARRHGREDHRRGVAQPRVAAATSWPATCHRVDATLIEVAADAADEAAMTALFDRFGTDLPPLEGIYLAAFAGGPVTLARHDRRRRQHDVPAEARRRRALLHRLSLKTPVRHFVLFSSISGLLGSRWLGHYAATTTFLDTLAYARRALGLPATVVNWGVWKSLADEQSDARQVTSESGLEPMADEVAIRALPWAMSPDAPVRLHGRRRGLAATGRRVSHPRIAAHRRRSAASQTTTPQSTTRNRVPQSIARLRTRTASRHAGRSHRRVGVGGDGPVGTRRFWTRRRDSSNSAWIR